ncbi:MAG: alpha/beta fold hydrolase [Pyrinomonadaceae bacterium]|nr:alpha/beta fold hydrolase [Phycisphaerales bacterium]
MRYSLAVVSMLWTLIIAAIAPYGRALNAGSPSVGMQGWSALDLAGAPRRPLNGAVSGLDEHPVGSAEATTRVWSEGRVGEKLAAVGGTAAQKPYEGDYIIRDFAFRSGEVMSELRIHYRTLGTPQRDEKGVVNNAVLIMHGTTGSGAQFFRKEFEGELFGKDQLLDSSKYYLILPDDIGHGGSSKPSDGMHAKFPSYGYLDLVEAEYRLVTDGLKINHLRLVMGTSMGGMHAWLWGELHPEFMDALMPLASLPAQVSGRNRVWRSMIAEGIRTDPEWKGGEYTTQPRSLRLAVQMLYFMSSSAKLRYADAPTGAEADRLLAAYVDTAVKAMDANDVLYAIESSRDYDPAPALEKIVAPLVAINSADDLINPPELGILEREIGRVKQGKVVLIPESEGTRGHGSHTIATLWMEHLEALLKQTAR